MTTASSTHRLPARAAINLTTRAWKQRAGLWWLAKVRSDPLSQLWQPDGILDPYPIYARLRAAGSLTRSGTGAWVVAGHEIAQQVLRDRRFGVREKGAPYPPDADSATPWDTRSAALDEGDVSFLELDPPHHTRLRRLVAPAFGPKMIASYRERIEQTAQGLLDTAVARGDFDLIADFAAPLPIRVISDLLGIPDVDTERFARYGNVVGAALDGIRSVRQAREYRAAVDDLNALFAGLIERRDEQPGDGVLNRLADAAGEQKLTSRELFATCRLLLVAGFETTVNLIGNGLLALLAHPAQWARFQGDPALATRVVEETLRYDPPVQATGRVAHEDVELAGRRVRTGQWVVVLLGAAGRDPDVHPDPERFDIGRKQAAEHLAFSAGIHYCVGAPLARLEGEIAFRTLAARLPELAQAGPVHRRTSFTIRGLSRFPLRVSTSVDQPKRA